METTQTLTAALKYHARNAQIDLIGITDARPIQCRPWQFGEKTEHYTPCASTKIGSNLYDPKRVLPQASHVIMVGMYMYGFDKIVPSTPGCPRGNIGPWTRGYVEAGRYATDIVSRFLEERGFQAVFTNALPYRTLAVQAGLGKIGKNGFLYSKNFGSYLRLGCVVTDARLTRDDPPEDVENDCGDCTICVNSCPTGALCADGSYDGDRCLHLWLQGQGKASDGILPEDRPKCLNYLMRTGRCLSLCRRNRKLKPRQLFPFSAESKPDSPELIPLVLADEDELHARLPYHVIKYGSENIRQNAIIALGNMKDAAAIPVLKRGLHTLSAYHRSLCAWALGELGAKEELLEAKPLETDSRVLLEIAAALQKAGGII